MSFDRLPPSGRSIPTPPPSDDGSVGPESISPTDKKVTTAAHSALQGIPRFTGKAQPIAKHLIHAPPTTAASIPPPPSPYKQLATDYISGIKQIYPDLPKYFLDELEKLKDPSVPGDLEQSIADFDSKKGALLHSIQSSYRFDSIILKLAPDSYTDYRNALRPLTNPKYILNHQRATLAECIQIACKARNPLLLSSTFTAGGVTDSLANLLALAATTTDSDHAVTILNDLLEHRDIQNLIEGRSTWTQDE